MMIKNIVFDIGNVLVKWAPQEVVAVHFSSHPAPEELSHQIFKSETWMALNRGAMTLDEATLKFSQALRIPYNKVEVLMKAVQVSLKPLPESIDLLNQLYNQNIPLYSITDNVHEFMAHLKTEYDFLPRFNGIVVSAKVGTLKPNEKIFLHLLNTYQLKAEETVFIDDVAGNVKGAEQLGMAGIHFTDIQTCKVALQKLGFLTV